MSKPLEAAEGAKEFVKSIFPEAYLYDTKRGGFDIVDCIDKDRAMSVGYGKTEDAAWNDAAQRQGFSLIAPPAPQAEKVEAGEKPAATEHLSVVELCLKHENLGEYIAQVESQLAAKDAKVESLEKQLADVRGAMSAQDEREQKAGELCGVPYELSGCDWPDEVADVVLGLRQQLKDARKALELAAEERFGTHKSPVTKAAIEHMCQRLIDAARKASQQEAKS